MILETLILIADGKFSTRMVTLFGSIVDCLFAYNEYKDFSVYNTWFTPEAVKEIIINNQNIAIIFKGEVKSGN